MEYDALALKMLEYIRKMWKVKPQRQLNKSMQGENYLLDFLLQRKDSTVFPSEISKELGTSTARTAAALNNLEKKGLVERTINKDDRRQINVTLTSEGKDIAETNRLVDIEVVADILERLGEEDAKDFVRILKKITEISMR